jgi:hypothetical protein
MPTPAEVIESFAGLRDGSTIARARATADAFRGFAALSVQEKRDLAVLVAERAAPHLVPRIQEETGLELTGEQVQAVLDMAGRLDADDLGELAETARDQEARRDALRAVATGGAAGAAATTGHDDVRPPPDLDEPAVDLDEPVVELDEPVVELDEEELAELGVEAAPAELDLAPEPTTEVAPAPEPREFVSIFDTLDTPAWDTPAEPATPPPTTHEGPRAGGPSTMAVADTPGARVDVAAEVHADRHPLVERLRSASTDAQRLRTLRRHVDDLAGMQPAGRRAVLAAVPDGWARRRAVELAVRSGVVPHAEVPDLVRSLASPVARAWVCATAVETDALRLDEVDDLLDTRAAERLHRRYG